MSWLKNILVDQPNAEMEKEQLYYQLRDAQNACVEMGKLLSRFQSTPPGSNEIEQMEQLNYRVGGFLERLQQRLDREINQ